METRKEIALYIVLGLLALITLLSALAPVRVQYIEDIMINAPLGNVYDDIRFQEHLMRWSAWPKETKSTCTVEGKDGEVGAKTVFFTKGKQVGHQEVVRLKENEEVVPTLVGPGPPHKH